MMCYETCIGYVVQHGKCITMIQVFYVGLYNHGKDQILLHRPIIIEDENGDKKPYINFKVCCTHNSNFSYDYMRRLKLPCWYKGFWIEKLDIIKE